MGNKICVNGTVLKCDNNAITATVLPATSNLSNNVKIAGNKAYHKIGFTATASGYSPTIGEIDGNSENTKGSGNKFVLENAPAVAVTLVTQGGSISGNVSIDNPNNDIVEAT